MLFINFYYFLALGILVQRLLWQLLKKNKPKPIALLKAVLLIKQSMHS